MEGNLTCVPRLARPFTSMVMSLTVHASLSVSRLTKVSFRYLPMKSVTNFMKSYISEVRMSALHTGLSTLGTQRSSSQNFEWLL